MQLRPQSTQPLLEGEQQDAKKKTCHKVTVTPTGEHFTDTQSGHYSSEWQPRNMRRDFLAKCLAARAATLMHTQFQGCV